MTSEPKDSVNHYVGVVVYTLQLSYCVEIKEKENTNEVERINQVKVEEEFSLGEKKRQKMKMTKERKGRKRSYGVFFTFHKIVEFLSLYKKIKVKLNFGKKIYEYKKKVMKHKL